MKTIYKRALLTLLLIPHLFLFGREGKFINPISDVCWSCLFPIHIAGASVTPNHKDYVAYDKSFCRCPKGLVGLPMAFWEPTHLVDVTPTPYKLLGFGGSSLGKSNFKTRGSISNLEGGGRTGFYHVHYYVFPILSLLDLGSDFVCSEKLELDIAYMSEFDPFWADDSWASILHPEVALFSNPLANAACIADCAGSSFNRPTDKLFWCGGCQGSLYPIGGFVGHLRGAIQASSLLVHRVLAKLHSWSVAKTFKKGDFCGRSRSARVPKSAYKTQLAYPIAQTKGPCNPLGKSEVMWGAGKTYPFGGEEFVYVIWTKKHCCLDPVKLGIQAATGALL